MRIGYFGGSFDPPHRGHLAVARAARDRFALDRVLLAPTARQPLKPHGPTASFDDRLRMTDLLCIGEPGLEASTIDGPRPNDAPNYTADTLRRLRGTLETAGSDVQLFAIIGADAFLTLPQWREPAQLFQLADWIAVSRPGFPLSGIPQMDLAPDQRTHVHLLDGVAELVSATDLRMRLSTGESCDQSLTPAVLAYIREKGLYEIQI